MHDRPAIAKFQGLESLHGVEPMPTLSRRGFLFAGASTAVAASNLATAVQTQDNLRSWLQEKAVRLSGIDSSGDNFTDLEPLGDAIGSARLVMLGEPSHGAGSAFAAKARIARFLHQRRGFDILVWESGFYDVCLAEAGMRSADDGIAAARRGIFSLWSDASQVKPLFDYVKASQSTLRPLEMAGCDLQVTADGVPQWFAADLHDFTSALREPVLRGRAVFLADQATDARARLFASSFSNAQDLSTLITAAEKLRAMVSDRRPEFEQVHDALETSFMDRAIENMRVDAMLRFDRAHGPQTTPANESRRDALNATNLRWLLEQKYPGRKALVWAHNVHVMKAYYGPDFRALHLQEQRGDMKPMGVWMADWLGSGVYSLGITTYQGEDGFAMGGPSTPIPRAPEGSVEAQLHALGYPSAFVDFRGARGEHANPFRFRQYVRMPKYDDVAIRDADRVFDGIVFIDQMSRGVHV